MENHHHQQYHYHYCSEPCPEQDKPLFLLDALYCEEDQRWEEEEEEGGGVVEDRREEDCLRNGRKRSSLLPLLLLAQDLLWEDEELLFLFSKEEAQREEWGLATGHSVCSGSVSQVRGESVEWMLRASAHHSFSALTAMLSIDYLDRFLSRFRLQSNKPWMIQLVAVACLSLAAKVEETHVPLLLDLQVGETRYLFEAKAIQRMELLVLSTLRWKMHPVTPLSFLDHIIRRLGLKNGVHWEFFRRCEALLLSAVSDPRSVDYLPSVLATATMLRIIEEVEPCDHMDYKSQLLRVLRMDKEKVEGCYQLIKAIISKAQIVSKSVIKRKLDQIQGSSSSAATETSPNTSEHDISSDCSCNFTSPSSPPSHEGLLRRPLVKRTRVQVLEMSSPCNSSSSNLSTLSRVFVETVSSPR
ncbi:hypothetical protein SAY86_003430 [Trapa natans]|uniref:B-like cyclin n=1 Tax=Trapa natans TaxID=22666 RepID=A0AAN7RP90_TRANT|nr:hypothetical protein SAY86_003430 [Trapa natans]